MRIVLAQTNSLVGDISGNTQTVIEMAQKAVELFSAEMVVFPELVLTGYPPEDLLLRPSLRPRIEQALERIASASEACCLVVGYPRVKDRQVFNAVGVFSAGQCLAEYHKQVLPNYQVFDEKRYFTPGSESGVFDFAGLRFALTICEDIWVPGPLAGVSATADAVLNISASPFHVNKQVLREHVLAQRSGESGLPILYANAVGGQDELVFDGGSLAMNGNGEVIFRAPDFEEGLYPLEISPAESNGGATIAALRPSAVLPDEIASIYRALVTGLRDYVNKSGFPGVILGLSGGIDSAVTLAIAVEALGADRVEAVMMPFRYTSSMSRDDAQKQAETLGVTYHCLSIEAVYEAVMETLGPVFEGLPADKTEENIQARCRGLLLMGLSNKKGSMVITTGNKSEVAVGYCTLYGDMVGGYSVLKDVSKTRVFSLARYINREREIIPERVITRPPSAELAPGQKDEDSLPPYEILDQVLSLYIEQDQSAEAIIARGFEAEMVHRVLRLVDINEYKRRQAVVGVRITERAFGRDRRYPIVSGWKPGN